MSVKPTLPVPVPLPGFPTPLDQLAAIPEEEFWLVWSHGSVGGLWYD